MIVVERIYPEYKLPKGGEPIRIMQTALEKLEARYGVLSADRITDYLVACAYTFKDRQGNWKLNQVFGPKSLEKLHSDKGRKYYEDRWLQDAGIDRHKIRSMLVDKSEHPLAKYIHMVSEEGSKMRLLNQKVGFCLCQYMTLGWSPLSEACLQCKFLDTCKKETAINYPEIHRLREEYVNKH